MTVPSAAQFCAQCILTTTHSMWLEKRVCLVLSAGGKGGFASRSCFRPSQHCVKRHGHGVGVLFNTRRSLSQHIVDIVNVAWWPITQVHSITHVVPHYWHLVTVCRQALTTRRLIIITRHASPSVLNISVYHHTHSTSNLISQLLSDVYVTAGSGSPIYLVC